MTTLQQQARALGDPTRHGIFRFVADADHPVGVAELTEHFGLNHNAIRQHLAKLVAAALLSEGKAAATGPGRPRLVYGVDPTAESRWGVAGPYERLSVMLAEALRSGRTAEEVGRDEGARRLIADGDPDAVIAQLIDAIARDGFDPEARRRGEHIDVVLQQCPFETTAVADPEVVCALHLGIAHGMADHVEGLTVEKLVPKDPRRAGCRLVLRLAEGPTPEA